MASAPPPYAHALHTVFLDNGAEREGDNIQRNTALMRAYISRAEAEAAAAVNAAQSHAARSLAVPTQETHPLAVSGISPRAAPQRDGRRVTLTAVSASHSEGGASSSIAPATTASFSRASLHGAPTSRADTIEPISHTPSPPAWALASSSTATGKSRPVARTANVVGVAADAATGAQTTHFISTVRGMYGGEAPEAPLYVQDRNIAVAGLRRTAAEANATDEVDGEEDNHMNAAPSGLSRILRRAHERKQPFGADDENGEDAEEDSEEAAHARRCPHCALSRDDPPVFQLMMPDPKEKDKDKEKGDNGMFGMAASSTTAAASASSFSSRRRRRYGNLPLGILAPSQTLDSLWNLVAILQPPKPLQVLGHAPAARRAIPQLAMDEWAILASGHFARHIGAPPWQEFFVRQRTELEEWTRRVEAECDAITAAVRTAQTAADKVKRRIAALERVLHMRDPAEERQRLSAELLAMQQDLVRRRWELEDGERRASHERLAALKARALAAVESEELRRQLAQIADMAALSAALGLDCAAAVGQKAREGVLAVLEELPTSRGVSARRLLSTTHDAHQCPNCLLLTVSSPYCPATGQPHGDLLSNLFEELSMGHGFEAPPEEDLYALDSTETESDDAEGLIGGEDGMDGEGSSATSTDAEIEDGEAPAQAATVTRAKAPSISKNTFAATENVALVFEIPPLAPKPPIADDTSPIHQPSKVGRNGNPTSKPVVIATFGAGASSKVLGNAVEASDTDAGADLSRTPRGHRSRRQRSVAVSTSSERKPKLTANQKRQARARTAAEAAHRRELRELLGSDSSEDDGGARSSSNGRARGKKGRRGSSPRHADLQSAGSGDDSRSFGEGSMSGSFEGGNGYLPAATFSDGDDEAAGAANEGTPRAVAARRQRERRDIFARLKALQAERLQGRSRGGPQRSPRGGGLTAASAAAGGVGDGSADDVESTAALEVMAHHMWTYLAAAADKDFPAMRHATRRLAGCPSYAALFSEATLRQLTDAEESFYAWYSVVGQLPPASADGALASLVKKAKATSAKVVEQRCVTLRKELRNLEYAFQKRPKGRGGGAVLDDSSFAALALKIADFERRNAALRIKLRQVNEQRRALARTIASM